MQSQRGLVFSLVLLGAACAIPSCSSTKRDFGAEPAEAGDSSDAASGSGESAVGGKSGVSAGGKGSGGASSSGASGMTAEGDDGTAGVVDSDPTADAGSSGTNVGGSHSGGASAGTAGAAPTCTGNTPVACSGGCVNLQSSPTNCGTCGHDCLGGMCSAGKCEPALIGRYDRYLGANGLSLGATDVYGKGESNLLVRAKKDGSSYSASSYLAAFGTSGCTGGGVAELNGRVFYQWNDGTSCRMGVCSTSDCDGTTQGFSPAGAASWVQSFGVDTTNAKVFWYDAASKRFLVASAGTSGTPTATTVSSGDITSTPTWTSYSAGGILFSDTSGGIVSIDRLPASGGSVQSVTSGTSINLNALWPSSSRLYFSDASTISYVDLPTGSGGPKLIVSSTAGRLWSDDIDLYWVDASDSTKLMSCALSDCASTTKTTFDADCTIGGLRGESNAIYWGISGGGCTDNLQLWKLAR